MHFKLQTNEKGEYIKLGKALFRFKQNKACVGLLDWSEYLTWLLS